MFPGGERYQERVPENTERYLAFLSRHGVRCTFFTVGDVARRYPSLIGEIVSAGHEIACHTSEHTPLHEQTRESFRDDLARCVDDLLRAGAGSVSGFRAPSCSIVPETSWAYEVLRELGFTYSSSVLAARSVLSGWPAFGEDVPRLEQGIWELPMSLPGLPAVNFPFAGGVYFRLLPRPLLRRFFRRRLAAGHPVVGYLHPFDIDVAQERFIHPQLGGSQLLSWFMYRNRSDVFGRLDLLLAEGVQIVPYARYVAEVLTPAAPARAAHG